MPIYEGLGGLSGDYKLSLVIDIGSAYTKIGFSGEFAPRFIIKSEVLCKKTGLVRKIRDYDDKQDLYDLLVEFIHLIYFRHALLNPKDKPVIIVESLLSPTLFRETLAEVLFHHYEISSLLVLPSHLVALSTLAIDTGLVVDVGYSEAVVIPVCHGVPVIHAWQALPLGSSSVMKNIKNLLAADNIGMPSLSEKVLEDIKVRCCFVTTKSRADNLTTIAPCPSVQYPLGGSKLLTVTGRVRETAYEIFFEEDNDHQSLSTMLLDAVGRVSVDLRVALAENVVLVGGTAMAAGLKGRLKVELEKQLKSERYTHLKLCKFKFHTAPSRENYTAWLGGAIYGCTEIVGMKALHREQYFKENRLPDWVNLRDNRMVS